VFGESGQFKVPRLVALNYSNFQYANKPQSRDESYIGAAGTTWLVTKWGTVHRRQGLQVQVLPEH